jgi:tRNA1(Val) A37 N6-methylase TrmN6
MPIWNFITTLFKYLDEKNLINPLFEVEFPKMERIFSNDILGTYLQKALTPERRKILAANYSTLGSADVLASLLQKSNFTTIIDPFCGSGRLIAAYLEKINPKYEFPSVRINDLMPSAVLLAYCRILLIFSKNGQELNLIHASIGDAFEKSDEMENNAEFGKDDLVLMNPPFTRTHRINKTWKSKLNGLEKQYKKYIRGQPGLHIFSIFLADRYLKFGGILAAILPASTILSKYSIGLRNFLLESYEIQIIASSYDFKSFSEDSSLREIILIAKRVKRPKTFNTKFLCVSNVNSNKKWRIDTKNIISTSKLAKEWNWTVYLKNPKLLYLREQLLRTNLLKSGKDLGLDIVRGVEMYGPDFFFVPNCVWSIHAVEDDILTIKTQNAKNIDNLPLKIPREYIRKILRKPGNYNQFISPTVTDFALVLPNSSITSKKWFQVYNNRSKLYSTPARRKFGSQWASHIHKQMKVKKPYGHLFLIDKFGISTTSVMAHFIDIEIPSTKNFYVVRNLSKDDSKLLAAWLNSSFFLLLFLVCRREIGGSYGRLQIMDYMKEPLFVDLFKISHQNRFSINREFDEMRKINLPPIPDQINGQEKKNLDMAIANSLNLPNSNTELLLAEIYSILKNHFQELKIRDKT